MNCSESQTKLCRAFISDCYARISDAHNKCDPEQRALLRKNVCTMLDRVKVLLGESAQIEQKQRKPRKKKDADAVEETD